MDMRGASSVKQKEYMVGLTYEKEETFDVTRSKNSVKGHQKVRLLFLSKETIEKHFASQDDDPNRWENQSMQDLRTAGSAKAHDRGDASDDNSEDLDRRAQGACYAEGLVRGGDRRQQAPQADLDRRHTGCWQRRS